MEKNKEILSAILDAGELMLMSGAEVSRVESTIEHMAKAYGFQKVDVFTIIFSIVVTVKDGEGNIETQTRRIEARDTDLHKVERINALSRKVCTQPVTLEDFKEELRAIEQEKPYSLKALFAIVVGFILFFLNHIHHGLFWPSMELHLLHLLSFLAGVWETQWRPFWVDLFCA